LQTAHTQPEGGSEFHSNIRPYVAELDQFAASYRAGKQTKFKVVSAIIEILNKDANLSPQERLQSFELYMAEVNTTQAFTWKSGGQPFRGRSASSDVSSDNSLSPLYIPPHHR